MMTPFQSLIEALVLDLQVRQRYFEAPLEIQQKFGLSQEEQKVLENIEPIMQHYMATGSSPTAVDHIEMSLNRGIPLRYVSGQGPVRSITRSTMTTNNTSRDYHALLPVINAITIEPRDHLIKLAQSALSAASENRAAELLRLSEAVEDNRNYFDIKHTPAISPPGGLANINIVGLGISGIDQITRETEFILTNSSKIYYVGHAPGVRTYLEGLSATVIDLQPDTYVEGEDRINAYRKMAAQVVNGAIGEKSISFALYGHPLVFAYPPFLIRRMASLVGLSVSIKPGVSCLDTLLTDLWVDPATSGMLVYEASDVLIAGRKFLPDVGAVVLQIGSVETALYSTAKNKPERFDRFVNHLLQFYPPEHVIHGFSSAPTGLTPPAVLSFSLKDMRAAAEQITSAFTLYIPPVSTHQSIDFEVADRMISKEHLENITKTK